MVWVLLLNVLGWIFYFSLIGSCDFICLIGMLPEVGLLVLFYLSIFIFLRVGVVMFFPTFGVVLPFLGIIFNDFLFDYISMPCDGVFTEDCFFEALLDFPLDSIAPVVSPLP